MSKGRSKPPVGETEIFKYYWRLQVSKMEALIRNDVITAMSSRMIDSKISTAQQMLKRMDLMVKCQQWGSDNDWFTTLNRLRDQAITNQATKPDVFKDYNTFRTFANTFYREQVAGGMTVEDIMKRITQAFEPPTNEHTVGPASTSQTGEPLDELMEEDNSREPVKKPAKPKFEKIIGSLVIHTGNKRDHYNLGDPIYIMRDGRMVNAKITSIVDESMTYFTAQQFMGHVSRYAIHATDYKKEVYEVAHIENLPCEVTYNYKTEVTPCV